MWVLAYSYKVNGTHVSDAIRFHDKHGPRASEARQGLRDFSELPHVTDMKHNIAHVCGNERVDVDA